MYDVVCTTTPREDWLAARRTGLGASDVPAILGLDHYRGALDVYADKAGLVPGDEGASEAADWGNLLEPVVAGEVARRKGLYMERGNALLRSRKYPWMLATPDAYLASSAGGPRALLQIKTTSLRNEDQWAGRVPDNVVAQINAEMIVTGLREAFAACLIGGQQLVHAPVLYDGELAEAIIASTEKFWSDLQQNIPPTAGPGTRLDTVKRLWPHPDGTTITVTPEVEDLVLEWRALKDASSKVEKSCKELEARVRAALGPAEYGVLPGGGAVTLKETSQPAKTMPACSYRVLRVSLK